RPRPPCRWELKRVGGREWNRVFGEKAQYGIIFSNDPPQVFREPESLICVEGNSVWKRDWTVTETVPYRDFPPLARGRVEASKIAGCMVAIPDDAIRIDHEPGWSGNIRWRRVLRYADGIRVKWP